MRLISRRFGWMILALYGVILIGGLIVWNQNIVISIKEQTHTSAQQAEPPITTPAPPSDEILTYARTITAYFAGDHTPASASEGDQYVFVSVSDGQSAARVALGTGEDVPGALDNALIQLDQVWPRDIPPVWIKLDVVQHTYTFENFDYALPVPLVRSMNGIAFDWRSGFAFLPEEVVANTLIDRDDLLRLENVVTYAQQRVADPKVLAGWEDRSAIDLTAFTSTSVFMQGDDLLPLYRGHRTEFDLSPEGLIYAANQGAGYLTHAVKPDGEFVYSYLPKTSTEYDDYNIIRHAGTIYAMVEAYAVSQDPALLAAIQRASDYLVAATVTCPGHNTGGDTLCVVENGWVKLGGNALAVVALAEYTAVTGDERYLPVMTQLADWIREAQRPDGSFVQKVYVSTNQIDDIDSQYYPGEAILAMTRLYAVDGDEQWLDVAENAAQYLITVRDAGLATEDLIHDHWLLYAINDLYRVRQDSLYYDHAMRIAESIVTSQNRTPAFADWLGSYYKPPRSTPTATRSEGLCAAYQLARDFGDSALSTDRILDALEYGLRFQLQTQFQPESALYLDDPPRVIGGFHRSLDNYEIRIDYVQHNISSLLCAAEVLGAK